MKVPFRRAIGDPLGFPTLDADTEPAFGVRGWTHLGPTAALRRHQVTNVRRFGRDVVVFADSHGELHATEAVCPHLGAHLGGSKVVGDCIRCPFHHWQFATDGTVQHVPNAKRIPQRARLDIIPVAEQDGVAFMYQGAGGDDGDTAGRPPLEPSLVAALRELGPTRTVGTRVVAASPAEVVARYPLATAVGHHRASFRGEEHPDLSEAHGSTATMAPPRRLPTMPGRRIETSTAVTALSAEGRVGTVGYAGVVLIAPMEVTTTAVLAIVATEPTPTGLNRALHHLALRQVLSDAVGEL